MVIICYYLKRWHKVYSMKAADTDSALIILSWKVSIITARPPNAKKKINKKRTPGVPAPRVRESTHTMRIEWIDIFIISPALRKHK